MAEAAAEAGHPICCQTVRETDSWSDVPDVGVRAADRAPGIMIVPSVQHAGGRIGIPL